MILFGKIFVVILQYLIKFTENELLEIIKEAHAKARAILADNRDKLDELANFLLEKETITGEEFMAVLNGDLKAEAIAEEEQA